MFSDTYNPTDLTDPRSVLSGVKPELKDTEHYFVTLSTFSDSLKKWIHSGTLQDEVANKLDAWFAAGLRDWDVTRRAPYFGFRIPDTKDKLFYVWVDAPIGYLASFMELCEKHGWDLKNGCTRTPTPKCIISSARTSSTFTACSGRPCSRAPACAAPPGFMPTAF